MAYLVEVTPRARKDLRAIYSRAQAEGPAQAYRWFRRLEGVILSREGQPRLVYGWAKERDGSESFTSATARGLHSFNRQFDLRCER